MSEIQWIKIENFNY